MIDVINIKTGFVYKVPKEVVETWGDEHRAHYTWEIKDELRKEEKIEEVVKPKRRGRPPSKTT